MHQRELVLSYTHTDAVTTAHVPATADALCHIREPASSSSSSAAAAVLLVQRVPISLSLFLSMQQYLRIVALLSAMPLFLSPLDSERVHAKTLLTTSTTTTNAGSGVEKERERSGSLPTMLHSDTDSRAPSCTVCLTHWHSEDTRTQ